MAGKKYKLTPPIGYLLEDKKVFDEKELKSFFLGVTYFAQKSILEIKTLDTDTIIDLLKENGFSIKEIKNDKPN